MSSDEQQPYDGGRECPAFWQLVELAENAADADEAECRVLGEHLDRCAYCRREYEIAAGRADAASRRAVLELAGTVAGEGQAKLPSVPGDPRPPEPVRRPTTLSRVKRAVRASARLVVSPQFAAGVLVSLLAGSAVAMWSWPDRASRDALWASLSRPAQPLTAVLPNDRLWLPVEGQQIEVTDRVGTGDALALGVLQLAAGEYGQTRVDVLTSEQIRDRVDGGGSLPPGPLVLIGGPAASQIALESMARLRGVADPDDPLALQDGFRFVLLPKGRPSAFSRPATPPRDGQPAELGIRDARSGELCPVRRALDRPYAFAPDAALVMLGNLDGRPVLCVAGFESEGGAAAMRFLAEPSPGLTRFYRIYDEQGYAEMVIRTNASTGEPELFEFPTASNPRGKERNGG